MKKSAFTLIELLVVISIIAILAGIALPVFGKVMERSRATSCASNLKQLGLGVAAYLNDNDEQVFKDPPAAGADSWPKTLQAKYVTNWKVFKSPFDKRNDASGDAAPVSYGINNKVLTQPGKPGWDGNFSKLIAPSQLIMMAAEMDPGVVSTPVFKGLANQNVSLARPTGTKLGTHNGRSQINVLFADSHVASIKFGPATDPEAFNTTKTESGGTSNPLNGVNAKWDPVKP